MYVYTGYSDELWEKTQPQISSRYDVVESVSEMLEDYGYILMASKISYGFSEFTWRDGNDTMRCKFEEGSELELLEQDPMRGGFSNDYCVCLFEW